MGTVPMGEPRQATLLLCLLVTVFVLVAAVDVWHGKYLAAGRDALIGGAMLVVAATQGARGRRASAVVGALVAASLSLSIWAWTR